MTPEKYNDLKKSLVPFRKITSAADNRMRNRTAKQQLAEALAALKGPDEIPDDDADDASLKRYN